MNISDIIATLEQWAPPSLQEQYDNCGLLTGNPGWECTGVLCTLDATEAVIREAIEKKCNMVVAHHPIIFRGLKKINGSNYIEQTIITAIKHDIAIYAIHTNLDNVLNGVSGKMADKLGLQNRRVLNPAKQLLKKLYTFVPEAHSGAVLDALFAAGAGQIGEYSECSFGVNGSGTFRGSETTNPFVGEPGKRHTEPETRVEVIFPAWLQNKVVAALLQAHPYEEVAYDIILLDNMFDRVGSGLVGELPEPMPENEFFNRVKQAFGLEIIRHSPFTGQPVKKVALCGGAGSFLVSNALQSGAQVFITADMKYHEFFDAEGRLVIADIGHYESEQFTTDLLFDHLTGKFPTFAVQKTIVVTNPVRYFG
ncbi:MAG: Nif3-like dinuclear metal center hexameric protein [Dinghuibacter sp.]|nr:Nif3-like dinuclear metal center hexameric protein [Dinghuibacter sp.]